MQITRKEVNYFQIKVALVGTGRHAGAWAAVSRRAIVSRSRCIIVLLCYRVFDRQPVRSSR